MEIYKISDKGHNFILSPFSSHTRLDAVFLSIFQSCSIRANKGSAVLKVGYLVKNIETAKHVIIEREHGSLSVNACLLKHMSLILVIIT